MYRVQDPYTGLTGTVVDINDDEEILIEWDGIEYDEYHPNITPVSMDSVLFI